MTDIFTAIDSLKYVIGFVGAGVWLACRLVKAQRDIEEGRP